MARIIGRLAATGAVVAAMVGGVMVGSGPAHGATFDVTSTSCVGPGSITNAIEQANASPGPDTIEIAPGLEIGPINTTTCAVGPVDQGDFYLARVTDDVVINGNGARIWGSQLVVTDDGITFRPGQCPGTFDTVVSQSPGLVRVASGTSIEIDDLRVENLSSVARLEDASSFTLTNSTLAQIFDFYRTCDRPAIWVAGTDEATVDIRNSRLSEIFNAGEDLGPVTPPFERRVFWGGAAIDGAGDLSLDGVIFSGNDGAVQWSSGNVDIATTQFGASGGWINASGGTTVDVVNSVFENDLPGGWDPNARIIAESASTVNLVASTLVVGLSDCPARPTPNQPDAVCLGGPGTFQAKNGSTIAFTETAIGVQIPSVGVPLLQAYGGTFTADEFTWIQPLDGTTPVQGATELRAITGQLALLTDPPGLPQGPSIWPDSHVPLFGDTTTPGVLIDAIADANCGSTNELLSPIDGSCLTTDVLGASRWDTGNNRRNIGAIQNSLAPHVVVTGVGDGSVALSWNTLVVPSTTVTGYAVLYREAGSSTAFSRIDVAGPATVTQNVTGLTNGTTYEFQVVGVSANGDGPPSNLVTATPSTTPRAPTLTAVPGDGEVTVSWTEPPNGGAPIQSYLVQYRELGATEWTTVPFSGTDRTTVIAGLTNGTTYEFRVRATNRNGDGPFSPAVPGTPAGTPPPTTTPPDTTLPPATTLPPPTTTPPPSGTLPETGSSPLPAGIAAALLLAGVALLATARRTAPRHR